MIWRSMWSLVSHIVFRVSFHSQYFILQNKFLLRKTIAITGRHFQDCLLGVFTLISRPVCMKFIHAVWLYDAWHHASFSTSLRRNIHPRPIWSTNMTCNAVAAIPTKNVIATKRAPVDTRQPTKQPTCQAKSLFKFCVHCFFSCQRTANSTTKNPPKILKLKFEWNWHVKHERRNLLEAKAIAQIS